jgi:hypothetical protein
MKEQSKGLWHNIRAKRARGEKPARKGSKAHKDAVRAAKRINSMNERMIYRNEVLRLEIVEHNEPIMYTEAEYQGRKVKLNKPMQGDTKKFKVYVKNEKGNVIKVNFGQKGMSIKKDNPERRKSFRARHKCDTAKDKTTPRYWSCRKW